MSSTEPPSRIHPKNHNPDSKAERDENTKKVEKVREVDPDEQARQRKKFRVMMGDEDQPQDVNSGAERAPSPFETRFHTDSQTEDTEAAPPGFKTRGYRTSQSETEQSKPDPQEYFSDVKDTIVPGSLYTTDPAVSGTPSADEEANESLSAALPQSEDFWGNVDSPLDQPLQQQTYQEAPDSAKKGEFEPPPKSKEQSKKESALTPQKKQEPSPFGVPGKPALTGKETSPNFPNRAEKPDLFSTHKSQENKKNKLPSPFDEAAKSFALPPQARKRKGDDSEEIPTGQYFPPAETSQIPSSSSSSSSSKEKTKIEDSIQQEKKTTINRLSSEEQEKREREDGSKRGDKSSAEIISPSLPFLPVEIQPYAQIAATVASHYLNPATIPLYFQMVGTIYMMTTRSGVNRTEIVLNNPSFAGSKFYGSTITIEKYATAPDSFNIRLTGSDKAVAAFKENIPSLMAAFQTGDFTFKVNRLDVEYTLERPVFRRRQKGEDKGDFGGDLGERRK